MAKELFRNNFDEEKHFALQFAESYFADQPQEQWTLRRQQDTDHKVPEKKAKKNRDQAPPASTSSSSTSNTTEEQDTELTTTTTTTTAHFENTILKELCLCLKVASFLDNPLDVQSLFCVNKAAVAIGKSPQAHPIRLQAVFGYFHVLQSYADQLDKLHYNRTELARFLTHLAVTMQTIYGPQYQVHPLHRTLVADMILKELCGVHHHGCDKQHENDTDDDDDENDDDEDDNRPLFHPQATKRQLSTDLFFTKCHRFAYSVVMGDHYYSFHKSLCQEHRNGHGHGGVIDESIRQDVLERQGHVCVYMYQDQDNFHLVSIQKKEGDDSLYMMGTNEKDEKFKSLAHYYVLGSRSSSSGGGSYPPVVTDDGDSSDEEEEDDNMPCVDPEQIVHRLQWLCQRRLLPTTISEEDWKALLESIGRVKEDFRTDCLAKAKPLMRLHLRCSPHK